MRPVKGRKKASTQNGEPTVKENVDVPWEYAVDCIVRNMGCHSSIEYVVR